MKPLKTRPPTPFTNSPCDRQTSHALVMLVKFPRTSVHAQADMLAEAERYLR